ncbi:MAG: ferritin family protein [Desulfobacteraceae bacterium]|nr:ferritin family protein [Desulfobacteraceae bacterium]MBC2749088.1 ferritin family protein [Desulfobacteraceae bacterium]
MPSTHTVEILKSAILLEKKGKAFYGQVAAQASHPEVKRFFELMADEEVQHINILTGQFKSYRDTERFTPVDTPDTADNIADKVLTSDLVDAIAAADYEAAAISAAMAMEKKAIRLYADRAATAEDPEEKALYDWLSRWEQSHLSFLSDLDREITERIWHDNNFWMF